MESATVTGPLHADEIPIDLPLVRALVDRALPACAALPLRPLGYSGSSNALFRLGDELLVRLPRQPGGSTTIDKEARWGSTTLSVVTGLGSVLCGESAR